MTLLVIVVGAGLNFGALLFGIIFGDLQPLFLILVETVAVLLAVYGWRWAGKDKRVKGVALVLVRTACVSIAVSTIPVNLPRWCCPESTVQKVQLRHGYSLEVLENWDVGGGEIDYSVHGQTLSEKLRKGLWMFSEEPRMFYTNKPDQLPHLTVHTSRDGSLQWVSADDRPNSILFMIDYSRTPATFWPKESQMPVWPNEAESNRDLARINADGGRRELNGYYRVVSTTEGS